MRCALYNGCSFVWGDELINPEESRFSKLISDHFGIEEHNLAIRGGSNDRILRTTVDYISSGNRPDFAIIVWSGTDRIEYFSPIQEDVYDEVMLQASPSRLDMPRFKRYKKPLTTYYSEISSREHESLRTLNYMLTVQTLFEALQIPLLQFQFGFVHSRDVKNILSLNRIDDHWKRFYEYYTSRLNLLKPYSKYGLFDGKSLIDLSASINDIVIESNSYGHPLESSQVLFKEYMLELLKENYDIGV